MMNVDMEMVRAYALHHSEAAFEELVSRYVNLVYSAGLRQVGDPHLAEEVTQAVFIILARKAGTLGSDTILPSWLHRTAGYVAADAMRARRRRAQRESEAHMQSLLNEPSGGTEETWSHIAPLLDHAIAGLNEKDRRVIVLRYFENRSLTEVGHALGANEDAVRMRIGRALEKLRKFFTKRGVVSTTTILASMMSAHSVQAAPAALVKTATLAAVTKGAAASGPTLIIVKGALKFMTWSKMKTAAVASVAVILTLGVTAVVLGRIHAARIAAYPDLQGAWEGEMHLDDAGVANGTSASTHVVLKLTKTKTGYQATTDWIERGRKDVPMGRVIYHYPNLRLEWTVRDIWNLNVNADATALALDHTIHIIQPDPVTLRRTASPDQVPDPLAETDFTPRRDSDLQGFWKGLIGTGPAALPVNLKIAELPDGTFRAEGDNPMQGANRLPITVTYHRPNVKLAVALGTALFEGIINEADTEIKGTLIQGGVANPAVLKRGNYRAELIPEIDKDYAFKSANDLPGHWRGYWTFAKAKIRLALDVARLPDGRYLAEMTSLDQFGNDDPIPASDLQYSAPSLRLSWPLTGLGFEGKLKSGKLTGTWQQGGGGFPIVFERQP